MADLLTPFLQNEFWVSKIKRRLPYLFRIAEIESSRGGHTGMEVGSIRERIIVALLIYKFGKENVITNIPITFPEADVILKGHDNPISIKTKSGKGLSGVKIVWTVDWLKVEEFVKNYTPSCDLIFIQVVWNNTGVFSYVPLRVQREIFNSYGVERYFKLPTRGTNPRGIEISSEALGTCISHPLSVNIEIDWRVSDKINYDPYVRWVELWQEE
uniref:Type II restriction endonuclease subunit R n=1 Tax=Thermocrinis ruber TaxID=75906 RepID=A0A7C5X0N8_9AQUI